MPYQIYQSDGTPITVPDNEIDSEFYNPSGGGGIGGPPSGLGVQIVGRNTLDYGAAIAQNFLQLTENFCSGPTLTPPSDATALQGQLWFNQLSGTNGNLYVRITNSASGGIANWRQILTTSSGTAINAVNLAGGATGLVPYQTNVNTTGFVSAGTNGQVLTLSGGVPIWQNTTIATDATNIAGGTANQIPVQTAPATTGFITAPSIANTYLQWNGGGFTWATVNATTAINLAGGAAGTLVYQSASNTTAFLADGTTGYVLQQGATNPQWVAQSTLSVGSATTASSATTATSATTAGSATTATTSTNLAGGGTGTLPYQSASNTTAMLAAGTTGYVLQANGAAAPSWVAPTSVSGLTASAFWSRYNPSSTLVGGYVNYQSGAVAEHGCSWPSNYYILIATTGVYYIAASAVGYTNPGSFTLTVYVNGSSTGVSGYYAQGNNDGTEDMVVINTLLNLSAGESVEIHAAGSLSPAGYGTFMGFRVA